MEFEPRKVLQMPIILFWPLSLPMTMIKWPSEQKKQAMQISLEVLERLGQKVNELIDQE